MIQRIQTVYLFLALLFTGSLFFLDMAQLASVDSTYLLNFQGLVEASKPTELLMPATALSILLALAVVLTFITIFLYKKRLLQIRLCALNLGLHAGLSIMIFYFGKAAARDFQAELSFDWPLVLPLAALILIFLALRAIGKDEALIRSLNLIHKKRRLHRRIPPYTSKSTAPGSRSPVSKANGSSIRFFTSTRKPTESFPSIKRWS